MNKLCMLSLSAILIVHFAAGQKKITLSKTVLQDKIKGGWAGQIIGVTFGGPTEFRFEGTMINDYQPIPWYDGYIKNTMINNPGLYDDLYMDLTFVDILEKEGLDAPVASHAKAYAEAGYMLWHANQAGRYNILHGIKPPQSGH
ncbi:MAG TPA: ADP-ribosylglycohydrolase family protein, partial [Cyclobacteriaceae bacterium]|nr:ADP-ribosylglycohydrolase family protein [Cyclobacteriaceae bacterium]